MDSFACVRDSSPSPPRAAVNLDDPESAALVARANAVVGFGIESADARISVSEWSGSALGVVATVVDRQDGSSHELVLNMPGRHNLANALAAIAGAAAAGVPVAEAVAALGTFTGMARRFDVIGTSPSGVTVIDELSATTPKNAAHSPHAQGHPGRVIAFFQPHGYGPLRRWPRAGAAIRARTRPDDVTLLCDPFISRHRRRSEGSERIVGLICEAGGRAEYVPRRAACGRRIVELGGR